MSDTESKPNPEARACPQCGAELTADAPGGLCPRCLMAKAMTPTEDPENTTRPEPPALEEVQAAFPQFEILEVIGVGGMGVVYKAKQTSLNRLVALKLLAPHREKEAGFSERFTREAQALAALNHPNIVTVHDFGQEGGFYYLLMEYVDGVNLRQAIKAERFTPEQALAIVPPICEALQFAHDRGIVHRDIKPENLLLDKDGRIKVADFGIARILDQPDSENTDVSTSDDADPGLTAGTALGTPNYMAPEQADHPELVDHRADIYSLGVVFYEMLTGEPPTGQLSPPSSRVKMDVRLDEIVLRALADSPELRWQSATELRTEIETIASTDPPPPLTDVGPPPRSAPFSKEAFGAGVASPSAQPRNGRGPLWLAIGLAIPGIPLLLLSLYLLFAVLNDNSWNPAPQEAFFVAGTWIVTPLVVGGSIFSLVYWLRRRAKASSHSSGDRSPQKKTAIAVGITLLVLLFLGSLILIPAWVIGMSHSRAQDAEQTALLHQQQAVAQDQVARAHQELMRHREQSKNLSDPDEVKQAVLIAVELEKEVLKAEEQTASIKSKSSRKQSTLNRGVPIGFTLLIGLLGIGLVIGVLVLLARFSKGLAAGCGVVLLYPLGLFGIFLLGLLAALVTPPNSHRASYPDSLPVEVVALENAAITEQGDRGTVLSAVLRLHRDEPDWELWSVMRQYRPNQSKADLSYSGSSSQKISNTGRLKIRLTDVAWNEAVRQEATEFLSQFQSQHLQLMVANGVQILEFTDAEKERTTVTLELRPKPSIIGLPANQIFIRDTQSDPGEGFAALAWNEISSTGGYDLMLETEGAAVDRRSQDQVSTFRPEADSDPNRFVFSRRKLDGGGSLRFEFPAVAHPDLTKAILPAKGASVILPEGETYELLDITDPATHHRVRAVLKIVPTGSLAEVLPGESDAENLMPGAPLPPPPAGASFVTERRVIMPGDANLKMAATLRHRDQEVTPLGEPLIFKAPIDDARGILIRWRSYPPGHATHGNRFVIDLVAAPTGVTFHRIEGDFPQDVVITTPDARPLPEENERSTLDRSGKQVGFRLFRAVNNVPPNTAVTDWWEVFIQVEWIDAKTRNVNPAFQLPASGSVH